jgi:SH3 domain
MFLLSLLFASTVLAQASASLASCFPLTGSQMCGPYADMQIQPLDGIFSDVASFDLFMNSVIDTNTSYIADYKTRYACPSFAGLGQRFHMSTYCGLFVNAASSNGCNSNAETIQICPATIATAISSLQSLYSSSVCNQVSNTARTSFLQGYTTYQSRLSNTSATCLQGFPSEIAQCGFFSMSEAVDYCSSNSSDPCCGSTQLQNMTQPLMIKNHLVANIVTTSQPSSSANAVVIGASIAGVVFFLIILAAVIYLYKKRKSTQSKTDKPSDNDTQVQIAETYEVIYNYVPNLSDEVYLYVGDKIIVKCKFDDGWALGYNMSTKQEGSFPMACVDEFSQGGDYRSTYKSESNINQRGSSLYISKY